MRPAGRSKRTASASVVLIVSASEQLAERCRRLVFVEGADLLACDLVSLRGSAAWLNPLAIGLSLSNVPVPVPDVVPGCCTWKTAGPGPVINTVTVRISGYTFTPMFTSVLGVSFPTVTFSDISATLRSYL